MEIKLYPSVRKFFVGIIKNIQISDFGKIKLENNEMISFTNNNNKEYDFVAKSWGFYATPSINGRLLHEGFNTALVKNSSGKYFVMVVDTEYLSEFHKYCKDENQQVVEWLNDK